MTPGSNACLALSYRVSQEKVASGNREADDFTTPFNQLTILYGIL